MKSLFWWKKPPEATAKTTRMLFRCSCGWGGPNNCFLTCFMISERFWDYLRELWGQLKGLFNRFSYDALKTCLHIFWSIQDRSRNHLQAFRNIIVFFGNPGTAYRWGGEGGGSKAACQMTCASLFENSILLQQDVPPYICQRSLGSCNLLRTPQEHIRNLEFLSISSYSLAN